MSQIYKVFFNNISFEIKPFSNLDSKSCCVFFLESFDDFFIAINSALNNSNDYSKKRIILKSTSVQDDWEKLIKKLKKFDFIVAAGGIVKNNIEEYLFIFKNGFWDFPKGKVEENETLDVAAKREVCEECGFSQLEINSFVAKTYHMYFEKSRIKLKETHWFLCSSNELHSLKPQLEEGITKLKWVSKERLPSILLKSFNSIQELCSGF